MSEAEFRWEHNQDAMAVEKLLKAFVCSPLINANWKIFLPQTINQPRSVICPEKTLPMRFRTQYGCGTKSQFWSSRRADGMADIAEVLWNDFLKHNPTDQPGMIATALFFPTVTRLCCSQFAASDRLRPATGRTEELPSLHSKTPGHPEIGYTPGVETTPVLLDKVWRTPSGWR